MKVSKALNFIMSFSIINYGTEEWNNLESQNSSLFFSPSENI